MSMCGFGGRGGGQGGWYLLSLIAVDLDVSASRCARGHKANAPLGRLLSQLLLDDLHATEEFAALAVL